MSQRIDAIFVNGVFRPETPVDVTDGQRVSLNIEPLSTPAASLMIGAAVSFVVGLATLRLLNRLLERGSRPLLGGSRAGTACG